MRTAILKYLVDQNFISNDNDDKSIKSKIDGVLIKEKKSKPILTELEKRIVRLSKVSAVYTFDFDVVESNKTSAGAAFKLPWLTEALDAGVGGGVELTRHGSRVFGAEDSWAELIADDRICDNTFQRSKNPIYPLTGSIGIGNVVKTFIDIDDQGGAKDNFVDELTFTTAISGSASAGLTLDLAPKRIRPTSISGSYGASRIDTHKLKLSLGFPQREVPPAITGVTRTAGDLNAPFTRPPDWQARYNLCVADARARENNFKVLRLEAPEVYCIRYAEAFSREFGFSDGLRRETRSRSQAASPRGATPTPPPATRMSPQLKDFAPLLR